MTTPALTPVRTPVEVTVATAGLVLLHVPPGVASVRVIDDALHTVLLPTMGAGDAVTVTVLETLPQPGIV